MYTVKQVSELASVTVRTLHYYDEIGLLNPSQIRPNGYRYYDDAALLRLQQILFYREIGLELLQIKEILDSPDFDLVAALRSHRAVLEEKNRRLTELMSTIDNTIKHLTGGKEMSSKQLFQAFSEEQQQEYEREARLRWGPDNVREANKRWKGYSDEHKNAIMLEGQNIYLDLAQAMKDGKAAGSPEVAAILDRWQQNIRHFYEPTLDILRGLGELYNTDPAFMAFFEKIEPNLTPYLQETITRYVDDLEYAEIERMLAEDEGRSSSSK